MAWGDYDNDGDLDLFLANHASTTDQLFRNNGNGTFTEVAASEGVSDTRHGNGAVWGDYDNDGDLDIYIANEGQANLLYRNNGNSNRWLVVKTVGTSSNKDGIGAKVTATTGATTQRRDVEGGSGIFSQSSLPVEFGFGSTNTVDQLTVTWPSGNMNTLTSVATNQTITVTELATPTLSSPADAATGQAISLTLSWNAVTGATSYRLQVSTVSNFASTVFDNAALAGTSQAVGPLSYNTTYYWRVRANNANSASAYSTTRSFTTVPNTTPAATAQTVTGNEDTDLTFTLAGTDADGQSLSALISTLPANGSLYQTADGTTRGAQITSVPTTVTDASKRVIYAPLADGNGAGHGNFGFKVNDGLVDSPEATVTVNVTAVNDAPTLSAIANPSAVLEDAGVQTVNLSGIGTGAANETQVLTVTAISSNTVLIPHPTVTYTSPNATGTLSYTPLSQASGTATITVTVTDDGGTANGGVNTVSRTFEVTVTPVNTVASFVMSHHNPVRAGDGLELSVSFRNPFGRTVPYTGTVRLAVEGGGIGGAGAQSVSGVTAVVFPLQTQVFRTADGAAASIPFTLRVKGVGSQSGTFQVRSRFLVPALALPAVEVRRGEEWIPFEQFAFVGGRSEQLRVRNLNAVRLRAYLDLSYLRAGEGGQPAPALLLEREVWLDPGAVHPFELLLPLYLDTAEGSGRLRLWRQASEGPGLTLAGEEGQVRLGRAPQVVEVCFSPVAQGQTVLVFPGERPGEHLVALGLEVDFDQKGRSQILSAQTVRVEVRWSDGRVGPADHYRLIGGFVRQQRTPEGELLLTVQGGWDSATRRRTHWLSLHTQVGLVPRPSLGVYTAPDGQQWRQLFFPYVAQVQRVAKPVVWEEEGLTELGQLMAEEARLFLAAGGEELLEEEALFLPATTRLGSNYPNPFNPFTQIAFELAEEGWVQLSIYELLGQKVRTLVDEYRLPGTYQVVWDGRDEGGRPVASGVYLYHLQTEEIQETKKMLLLR
ncbi:MAG: ASPIC/UnbV domain-containing protein [Candidatus Latescibacteria bacterium]|nr:ASPIC/UnbV domain-containing protein [Candidatus Latescibacterota bacterium]